MVKLKLHNHSFGYNVIHIVFVTKYRHPVITKEVESRLKEMLDRLCKTQDSELLECKADLGKQDEVRGVAGACIPQSSDHIHLLVDLAPRISLGKLCNILKTISSREIRKEFATELKPYYWKPSIRDAPRIEDSGRTKGSFWKRGYGYTSSGDAPIEILKKYIENQGYND